MSDGDIDRLVKFAGMMLGQLRSAKANAEAMGRIHKITTGTELVQHEVMMQQFDRSIAIGEAALAPFESELSAQPSLTSPFS
jgi:hypothetical protein